MAALHFCNIMHPLMMARECQESTWEPVKYGKFICQIQADINKYTAIWKNKNQNMLTKIICNN